MRDQVRIDHCVVGGGIVGLFTAYFLRLRFPKDSICLLEKEIYFGDSSTGRNSGVLHSGIYYSTNSLKHLLCMEGAQLLSSLSFFSESLVKMTGKFIFAKDSRETAELEKLFQRGIENNIDGLRFASEKEVKKLENFLKIESAIYSPVTGIINVPAAIKNLVNYLGKSDVMLMKSHGEFTLERMKSGFNFGFPDFDLLANKLYNCAGLSSITLRKKLGLNDLEDYYVKGSYLATSQKIDYPALLYPMPLPNLKGLGIHSTLNWDGTVKFGPNAREVDSVSYSLEEENLEEMKDNVVDVFHGVIREKLHGDYSGMRAKIKMNGEVLSDFWIKNGADFDISNYYEACGIESPGLTASPAIGKMLANFS